MLIDNPNTGRTLESANEIKPDDEISPFDTLSEATIIETVTDLPFCGSTSETIYKNSFCLIPGYLSDYIGHDKYIEWQENVLNTPRSNKHDPYQYINIYEFIKHFDISRNEFEEIYYTSNLYYLYDYNFDILYGDSADDVYEYYNINTPENIDVQKRGTELSIKKSLKKYVGKEKFNEWLREEKLLETTYFNDVWWGISEAVYKFDISRDVLAEIISECTGISNDIVKVEAVYEDDSTVSLVDNVIPSYTYNLDIIYEADTENVSFRNTTSETILGYKLDEILRLVDK